MMALTSLHLKKLSKNSVILSATILIIISLVLTQIGIIKLQDYKRSQKEFIKLESQLIKKYTNYRIYGIYGFRLGLFPSPLFSLFYKSSPFTNLQSYVDNAARLDFQKSEAPQLIFNSSGFMDFFTFLTLVQSIFCVFLGYFVLKDTEYITFLRFYTKKNIYLSLFLSQSIFIFICLVIQWFLVLGLFLVNRIGIEYFLFKYLFLLFLSILLTFVFCCVIGMFAGTLKKSGVIVAVLLWGFFTIAIPESIDVIINRDASKLSRHMFELSKISVLMDFEKDVYNEKLRNHAETPEEKFKIDKKMTDRYHYKDSKKIDALEKSNISATKELISKFHKLSNISPFTFLKSSANEIGSMGYNSYLSFYLNNRYHQKKFFLFYKNHVYENPYSKVIPYLKEGDNIFLASPSLPQYFHIGLLINIFYIFIFYMVGFLKEQKVTKETD